MSSQSITKALLQQLYERDGLSATRIAAQLGSLPKTILYKLRSYGIAVRPYRNAVPVPCDNCGKILRRPPSSLQSDENHLRSHVFCNKQCHNEWMSKHPRKYGEGTVPETPNESFLTFVHYYPNRDKHGNVLGNFLCAAVGPPHDYRGIVSHVVTGSVTMCRDCVVSLQTNRLRKRKDIGKLADDLKLCPGCDEVKPRSEFYRGRRGECKECSRKRNREMTVKYTVDEWHAMSPEEANRFERCEEIARVSVESSDPRQLIDYATASFFATGLFATAFAIEDNKSGICR